MTIDLRDKVVIITGAGRGIGRAIALGFAKEHARLVLASRSRSELERLRDEVKQGGVEAIAIPTDVTAEDQVKNLIESAHRSYGRIDVLVNNAGIGIYSKVVEMKTEDFRGMFDLNVTGVFFCTRAVLPFMMKQNDGVIVNIASLAGRNAFIGGAGYCATKWALIGFARSLMLEVREHNIRVITICPGSVDTSFSHSTKGKANILLAEDIAETVLAALRMPSRAMVSEIDIRPTNPKQ
ncbi:MAG: SDR family NAD(P)-dependent oxidoreductase [Bacteroidota bacterium]|jgi:3-oxoacyl-[acyl-carrier protein] reductase